MTWCHDSYQTVTPYAGLEFFTSAPSFEVVGATAMPLLKLWKQGTQLPPTVDLHTDPPVSIVRDPGSNYFPKERGNVNYDCVQPGYTQAPNRTAQIQCGYGTYNNVTSCSTKCLAPN